MNKLYALLTCRLGSSRNDDYYAKKHIPVQPLDKAVKLLKVLTGAVPDDRLMCFACFLCAEVMESAHADKLKALDPLNTYGRLDTPDGQDLPVVYDLLCDMTTMERVKHMLDDDLRELFQPLDWVDDAALLCVQILRDSIC